MSSPRILSWKARERCRCGAEFEATQHVTGVEYLDRSGVEEALAEWRRRHALEGCQGQGPGWDER